MIQTYRVCVIKGNTGCGKTTQIPQMILDSYFAVKKHCNIVVTQPRRIAAISVAKRVSDERNWELSTIVGYQVCNFVIKFSCFVDGTEHTCIVY